MSGQSISLCGAALVPQWLAVAAPGGQSSAMHLPVSGHPLHTRAIRVTLTRRDDGKVAVAAALLDVRKHGYVPVSGDLQSSGVVHDMRIDALVDAETRVVESAVAVMPSVAIEASAVTRGESCRDVGGKIASLVGLKLDGDFVSGVRTWFGGPLGCSHLLTLTQLLAPTVAHALDVADARAMGWKRGAPRRLFYRSLIVDGHEAEGGEIQLAAQLLDLYFKEAPALPNPMDRLARQQEVRLLARLPSRSASLAELRVGERVRDGDALAEGTWRQRPEVGEALATTPLLGGMLRDAAKLYGRGGDRPLCDALQSLPGTLLQVMGARSESWPERVAGADTVVGIGGLPDSCYMWRSGGALHAARRDSDPQPRD